MEHEFYRGLAQRVRDIAERVDPFTKRRLLELAELYAVKGIRPEPAPSRSAAKTGRGPAAVVPR